MPQQINLSTPILLTQRRYFSAQTMALSLVVFAVLGGGLCAAWVWNLQKASAAFTQAMADQTREIDTLQAAIQRAKASAAPVDPALVQLLQERRKLVAQRGQLLNALEEGLFRPGQGHSDRLLLVARSIPAPVWVTEVKADASRFEVSGFTLEPAALNDWVDRLSASPLLRGMKLATVKVENAAAAQVKVPLAAGAAASAAPRPVWSFNLVSLEPPPVAVAAGATTGTP
jgi:Tfp pilus assembly protein PilN